MIHCEFSGTPAVSSILTLAFFVHPNTGVLVDQLVNERQNTADLLAAALTNDNEQDLDRGQSLQSTDALQSLLATAAEGEDVLEYEDIIDQEPVQRPERPRQLAGNFMMPNLAHTGLIISF